MASRFLVASNNWNSTSSWSTTSGGASGAAVPTAADDVFLDANSNTFTVTITANAVCRSLDCSGLTGGKVATISHGAFNLSVGTSTANGTTAMILATGLTWTITSSSAALIFVSTSATQLGITSAGVQLPLTSFTTAGTWKFLDNVTTSASTAGSLSQTAGTVDYNGKTYNIGTFASSGATARTVTLGSSTFNVSGGVGFGAGTSTNLTVTANTATVNMTAINPTFTSGGAAGPSVNWNGLTVVATATTTTMVFLPPAGGSITLANLTLAAGGPLAKVSCLTGTTITVTGTLTISGSGANRLLVSGSQPGSTAATISAATTTLDHCNFRDITAAGAGSWSGTSIGNCLGNTGITFTGAVTRYWVGGTGNWSDTTHWSTSSGGASGASFPLPQDTAILDANSVTSGGQTITLDVQDAVATLDCHAVLNTPAIAPGAGVSVGVYGSLDLSGTIPTTPAGTAIALRGRSGGLTVKTGGSNQMAAGLTVAAPGGTYTMSDNLSIGTGGFTLNAGAFNDGGNTVTAGQFICTLAGITQSLTMSGTWNLGATTAINIWNVAAAAALTLTATGSTIALTAVTANAQTFVGNGLTYGNLVCTAAGRTGTLTITGANTFNDVAYSDASNGRTLIFPASTTTTIAGKIGDAATGSGIRGLSGGAVTLQSSSGGTAATLSFTNGGNQATYNVAVQDITATFSGGGWYVMAGTNTSGNTGIVFGNAAATGAALVAD